MAAHTCRKCIYMDVYADRDGVKRVRSSETYNCTVPKPEPPTNFPDSWMHFFREWGHARPRRVTPDQGMHCPGFTPKAVRTPT